MIPIENQIEPLLECAERIIAKHPKFKDEIYSIIDLTRDDLQGQNPFPAESTIDWLKKLEIELDELSKASGELSTH